MRRCMIVAVLGLVSVLLTACSSDGALLDYDDSASSGQRVRLLPWSGASKPACAPKGDE